jgi:hypothetical protein
MAKKCHRLRELSVGLAGKPNAIQSANLARVGKSEGNPPSCESTAICEPQPDDARGLCSLSPRRDYRGVSSRYDRQLFNRDDFYTSRRYRGIVRSTYPYYWHRIRRDFETLVQDTKIMNAFPDSGQLKADRFFKE